MGRRNLKVGQLGHTTERLEQPEGLNANSEGTVSLAARGVSEEPTEGLIPRNQMTRSTSRSAQVHGHLAMKLSRADDRSRKNMANRQILLGYHSHEYGLPG
jgi:hypothetical protein